MKKGFERVLWWDSLISSVCSLFLVLDTCTDIPAPIDWMNYTYIAYYLVRMITLPALFRKRKDEISLSAQWGYLLSLLSTTFFVIVAANDIF